MHRLCHAPLGGAVLTACTLGALGFLPLFGGPGYESALAAGLVVPVLAACGSAQAVLGLREAPFERFSRGLYYGAALATVALGISVVHGVRAGFCDAESGVTLFLLGPGAGACLSGVWGAVVGSSVEHFGFRRGRLLAVVLAILGPLASALVSVWRFYSSPIVFAFDPFVGFFAGPIYETIIDPNARLATYRVGSLLSLLAVGSASLGLRRTSGRRLALRRPARPMVWALSVTFLLGSLVLTAMGPALGHYQTARSIREALGRRLESSRCSLVFSRDISERDAKLTLSECDAHVEQLERYFDVRGTPPITLFLFASAAEKGRLMGAARTFIAKPWRHEVYLQQEGYPHPVLGHELAHVVAGGFGRGPFRVAGSFSGFLPDPGRIEGFAVAASPRIDADLDLARWAAALLRLDLLPTFDQVFELDFLGVHSKTAYTVAGAFVEWFRKAYGTERTRLWYSGQSLLALTGKGLETLEQTWRAELRSVHVSATVLDAARARFDRPGLFRRRCPHEVDQLESQANGRLAAGDLSGAIEAYQDLLRLDENHVDAVLGLARCSKLQGALDDARQRLDGLARADGLHSVDRGRAEEALADLAFTEGNFERARALYAKVAERVVDEDHLRALDVKQSVSGGVAARAVSALLIGRSSSEPGWDVAGPELGAWAASGEEGLPRFLLGKNLFLRGKWEEAGEYLDAALHREIALPRARREALRMRLWLACARRETSVAQRVLNELRADPELGSGHREGIERFGERCGLTVATSHTTR